jgi:hypothetical protein
MARAHSAVERHSIGIGLNYQSHCTHAHCLIDSPSKQLAPNAAAEFARLNKQLQQIRLLIDDSDLDNPSNPVAGFGNHNSRRIQRLGLQGELAPARF